MSDWHSSISRIYDGRGQLCCLLVGEKRLTLAVTLFWLLVGNEEEVEAEEVGNSAVE